MSWVQVVMKIVARNKRTIDKRRQSQFSFIEEIIEKGNNHENFSRTQVLVKMMSVARDLSIIKEQHQDQ
jgi:hypothetical protein